MSFIEAWKQWSLNLWNKFGNKLQKKYNDIDSWQTPDWCKKMLNKIWDNLDDDTKKYLYTFTHDTCSRMSEKSAKEIIKESIKAIQKRLKTKK